MRCRARFHAGRERREGQGKAGGGLGVHDTGLLGVVRPSSRDQRAPERGP